MSQGHKDTNQKKELGTKDRAKLRSFLVEKFSIAELKTLAFDLGVDYECFHYETKLEFSIEFLGHVERKGQLDRLITEILKVRDDDDLVQLLAKLSSGSPAKTSQIIAPKGLLKGTLEFTQGPTAKHRSSRDKTEPAPKALAYLAVPRLLKLIDTTQVDPEIMARCQEALRLRYRGKIDQAIDLNQAIVRLANKTHGVNKPDSSAEGQRRISIGIALLYLAYIQHLSEFPHVLLTSQMALTRLDADDHNHTLGELVTARLMLEESNNEVAFVHYRAALSLLSNLIRLHQRNKMTDENEYYKLYQLTKLEISYIQLVDQSGVEAYERLTREAPEPGWLDRVQIPSKLVWPGDNLVGLHLMPIQSTEGNQGVLSPSFKPVPGTMDYIEIKQVSLNGRLYEFNVARETGNRFFMHVSQPYYAFQFDTVHDPPQSGEPCYALVRQFDRPQHSDYPIVILIPQDKQAWLVSNQPTGASETIIGEREWAFYEGGPKITESKVQVVGVVVAILTLLPAPAVSSLSATSLS
jgi:hypothetical protein